MWKKMHHVEGELNKIEKAINENTFWKLWKNINRNPCTETNPIQNSRIWKNYFDDLYKNPECHGLNPHQILTTDKLKELEMTVKDIQCALDYPITIKEIQHKIKTLKNGKACCIDSINSEMLKHSNLGLIKISFLLYLKVETSTSPAITGASVLTATSHRSSYSV